MSAASRATQYTVLNAALERLQKNLDKLEDNVEVTQQPPQNRRFQIDDTESEEYQRLLALHDSFPPFWLTPTIQLGPLLPSDKEALLKYMNDPRVFTYLAAPPNPYKPGDADWWIHHRATRMLEDGTLLNFAIRDMDKGGLLIGSIEISSTDDTDLEGDDVGYWLSPDYQGKGLMARAAKLLIQEISIGKFGKRKFNAFAFEGNWASRRTLEKIGMIYCPDMGKTIVKHGVSIPCWRLRMFLSDEDVAKREKMEWAIPAPHLTTTTSS
ncbi:hypothetical protein BGW42_005240 [Actinomortierella wolfii]|nr:hypothetical protein BGW42_005240 [Actinomortierella wolfii]